MKTWFHRLFLAVIFTLTFAHVHVGVSVPNGLTSAQISVSVFDAAYANSCVANNPAGNWGTAGTWATCGGVAPTSADTCSITGTGTITVESAVAGTDVCGTTDFTGFTGTLSHAASKELDIYGSLTLVSGMTYAPSATSILKFKGTTTGFTIATGTKKMGPVTFDGVGGGWTLQDNFDGANSNQTITLTNSEGTTGLNINGKTIGATNGYNFSSSNSNIRALTLGAATWNFPAQAGTIWDITTPTNMAVSAASSTLAIANAGNAQTFIGGGFTYGTVTNTGLSGSGILTIGGFSATTLTLSAGASATTQYKLNGNITVSGTCTGNGNSVLNRDWITSDTKGTARTLSCGTSTFTNADFQDITAAGGATWSLAAITGGSGNCGGNTGITFTTPISAYHKTAVSDNWSAANWYTTSGGSTPISPQQFPLCQDTAIFDANSVTAGSKTITIDASALRISAMNWTGVLNTPALAFTTAASYFGSITLVSGMTVFGTGLMTLEGRGSQNFTIGTLTLTAPITINAPGGTWTQQDAFTSSNNTNPSFVTTAGTWAAGANNTTLSAASGKFTVNGGTFSGSGTLSLSGATAANITVSSGDLNMPSGIVSMTGASSTMTLSGGTAEIGTLTRTGFALTIAGTVVQLGTGGAAFATPLTISSGSLAPTTGNKITSVSSTAIAVSANSGGGSCSFGDAGQWRDWNEANDNAQFRKAM